MLLDPFQIWADTGFLHNVTERENLIDNNFWLRNRRTASDTDVCSLK